MLEWWNDSSALLISLFAESPLSLLFWSGFLSATLLPGGSEAALLASLSLAQHPVWLIVAVSTAGNTLGGMTNYALGLWLPHRTDSQKQGHKAKLWLQRYGYWALLGSWLPIIGDPLCLAAGWLRLNVLPAFLMILIGKALRYSLLAVLYYGLF
ncbi:DedA family protein [Vibrio cholerae]|uniref:YqaA family protein n=1 Tax=Vibrio cholerae TaxID=666 RepID=UPI000E0BBCA9|nr:YqaA family protein [Vibrio cholerae]ELJ8533483.1 DedA family protein [Vibrio cholerae]HAS3563975.1 DedA family protein [Vibrio cholerae]